MRGLRGALLRRWLAALAAMMLAPVASAEKCSLYELRIPTLVSHESGIASGVAVLLRLNGNAVGFLLDSSKAYSTISMEAAKQLKLPLQALPAGERSARHGETYTTVVSRLGFGVLELKAVKLHVTESNPRDRRFGVLGRDLLAFSDTEYDLGRNVVRLFQSEGDCAKANLGYWANPQDVSVVPMAQPRYEDDSLIRVPVSLNGTEVLAALGTGWRSSQMTRDAARRAGIPDEHLLEERSGESGREWVARLDTFQLGQERLRRQRMGVEEVNDEAAGDYEMKLGIDYMVSHRIYVSYQNRKIYATWNGQGVFSPRGKFSDDPDQKISVKRVGQEVEQDAEMLVRLGRFEYGFKNYASALERLTRAITLKPDQGDAFVARARVHYAMSDHAAALKDVEEAMRLFAGMGEVIRSEDDVLDARLLRAGLRAELGDRAGALADLAELDELLPADADLRYSMAGEYRDMNQEPEAFKQMALWIDSHPDDVRMASALNNRCFFRVRRNIDLPLALRDCERAIELNALSPDSRDSLGWVWLRMGEHAKASSEFGEAIRLNPKTAWPLYGRSLVRQRQGDAAGAKQDLEAARQIEPEIDRKIRESGLPTHDDAGAGAGAE